MESGKKYSLGEFELETGKRLLTRQGEPVRLAHRPFQVLVHLIENHERLVTRQELLDLFWEGRDVYDLTLSRCVSSIRKALDDQSDSPRFIETRWAEGYRFIGAVAESAPADITLWEVERVRGIKVVVQDDATVDAINPGTSALIGDDSAGANEALDAVEPKVVGPARMLSSRGVPRTILISLVVLVIAMALGGIWLYRHRAQVSPNDSAPIRSIAVLPLKNLSGDPTNEYFSDGLTESLITALSKIEGLKVISRSAVYRFKNRETTPAEIGKNLGVATVLEGGVRNAGNSVRIDLRLVNAEDGRVLWVSNEHEHALGDLFALQDQIARDVAATLKLRLSGETERKIARRYTDNLEAYQLYLQGRSYWNNYSREEDLLRAIEYFQSAIAKDPNYALAYTGLADSYSTLAEVVQDPKVAMPKAREYSLKALELDNTLGEAHYSRGAIAYFYEWDWQTAQQELDCSLALNAKSLEGNVCYLHSLGAAHQAEDALVNVRKALDENPLSVYISGELSCASYYARHYDQAIDFSLETLRMDSRYMYAHYNAARGLGQKKMYEQAITELNKAAEIAGRMPMLVSELGYNNAAAGRKDEARRLLNELQTRSQHEFIDPYPVAFIYAALGENDKALSCLEKAYDARSTWMPWIKAEPKFDGLRSDPRFISLVKRMNLT